VSVNCGAVLAFALFAHALFVHVFSIRLADGIIELRVNMQEIARNTFTISALLLTACIVLLRYSWKRLEAMISTMPPDKRRIRFELGSISDRNEYYKYEYIWGQFVACVFLALAIFGALIAISVMSGIMVGDVTGIYAKDNFELAVAAMRAGIFCLVMGMLCLGMVYVEDLVAVYRGEPSVTMTKLEQLPKRPPLDKARPKFFTVALITYIVILGLIEIFVPHNQWVKLAIAIVGGIVVIVSVRFGYRAYLRRRNKRIPTESN